MSNSNNDGGDDNVVVSVLLFGVGAAIATTTARLRKRKGAGATTTSDDEDDESSQLRKRLLEGTTLNAGERVCLVTPDNVPIDDGGGGGLRSEMRLHNLWHRATYVLIRHEPMHVRQHEDVCVLVQRRSAAKDYCPGKLDPTPGGVVGYGESYYDNAVRELNEEMGIDVTTTTAATTEDNGSCGHQHSLRRLFTFPYQDDKVRVWGEMYECVYRGTIHDLKLQEEEVDEVLRMPLQELRRRVADTPEDFMPDACHAMRLYFQRQDDIKVNRRLLKGYSNGSLDSYGLRPPVEVIFFDCDDTLYFDGWKTADQLTHKIDEWCVSHGLKPGQAYELYKQYGTALRGLLAEGYLDDTPEAIDGFLRDVHDIPVGKLLSRDTKLREILEKMDPAIPKYIFTASVADHARRCLRALGIEDIFVDIIDCKRCDFESKHSEHSFRVAMEVAGVSNPERCLFLDDSLTNIRSGRQMGWRSVLVGRIGRDCGKPVTSEHAELEIDRIHEAPDVLPELFP